MSSIKNVRRSICMAAAATVAAFGTASTSQMAASAAAHDPFALLPGTIQIGSDLLSGIDQLMPNSPYNPAQELAIGVMLQRPDPAGEDAYLADVYNRQSPNFRHFLDVAGFQQRFGVSQARYAALLSWLQQGGLTTSSVAGSTEYALARGPAAAVEALFQVQINNYTTRGVNFYGNTAGPTVPANLGILGVAGLQNLVHMRTDQEIHAAAVAGGQPNSPAAPGPGTKLGNTTPQDLWHIYGQPASNRGSGENMAIFGWGCTTPTASTTAPCAGIDIVANLRAAESTFGLPTIPIQITYFGDTSGPFDTNGTGEWTLDLPASTGMAPDAASEHLYFGVNGQDPDMIAAYTGWNMDPSAPRQGSSSFGGCEATPATGSMPGGPGNPTPGPGGNIIGNPNQDLWEAQLKEAVALGHTMFVSTGDLGANGCPANANTSLNGVTPSGSAINTYPASSTYVTAVGGTVLYWNGSGDTGATPATRALEYSWAYSGGGTSLFIKSAAWQNGGFATDATSVPGLTGPCPTDWQPTPNPYPAGTLCRGQPDVDAQSGDVLTNGYFAGGGTSLSSPLWLGMWTRIQAASSNPGRLGFATPAIYANNADATRYANDFFDIGQAGNLNTQALCDPQPGPWSCSKSGWDYASGWGTPNITNLMKDLDNGNTLPVPFVPIVTPEAPFAVLLAAAGLATVAAIAIGRRRRPHRHQLKA